MGDGVCSVKPQARMPGGGNGFFLATRDLWPTSQMPVTKCTILSIVERIKNESCDFFR